MLKQQLTNGGFLEIKNGKTKKVFPFASTPEGTIIKPFSRRSWNFSTLTCVEQIFVKSGREVYQTVAICFV
ncbi:hypothetical protein [Mucilaginibacter sp.]|uniref:hypothetical protein n=1 Tax=Mucilaginibacter sp. TaxID=1882438 RepID=UPI003AFF61B6